MTNDDMTAVCAALSLVATMIGLMRWLIIPSVRGLLDRPRQS